MANIVEFLKNQHHINNNISQIKLCFEKSYFIRTQEDLKGLKYILNTLTNIKVESFIYNIMNKEDISISKLKGHITLNKTQK